LPIEVLLLNGLRRKDDSQRFEAGDTKKKFCKGYKTKILNENVEDFL
jgi:hypothetical protein